MAELGTLARPYAKAVFETALGANALGSWLKQLTLVAQLSKNSVMQQVFNNPSMTSEQHAQAFLEVCGEKVDAGTANLVKVLADNKRLALLPAIAAQFETLKREQEKSLRVQIYTAFPLQEDTQQRLVAALQNKLARDIEADTVIDETLIGGVVIHAGDVVIDDSVKAHLAKLTESMNS